MAGGSDIKAPVYVLHGMTYYRWVDWCKYHSNQTSGSPTFFCRFYKSRLSMIFCKEQCRHRRGL